MKISCIQSNIIYDKIANAPAEKKDDIFRYEMMMPFEKKWACYNIPIKALRENGYDVVMACEMLGFLPPRKVTAETKPDIGLLSDRQFWRSCQESVEKSFSCFQQANIALPVQEYV